MNKIPKLSIITPSYNQAEFLEDTIRSVVFQNYPNLEYLVIDGGSSDGSLAIIKEYSSRISYWVSEKDRGQAHAINKGLSKSSGEIIAWINSDDIYQPGAFSRVIEMFNSRKEVDVIFGDCHFIDVSGNIISLYKGREQTFEDNLKYWEGWPIPQPTVFWRAEVMDRVGVLNENLHYGLDYEYFLRMSRHYSFTHAGKVLASYRIHSKAKSGNWDHRKYTFYDEIHPFSKSYWSSLSIQQRLELYISYIQYQIRRKAKEGNLWAQFLIFIKNKLS